MLVSVVAVASQDAGMKELRWGGRKAGGGIDTVYHTIQVTGMTGDSMTFNILNSAVKGKSGNVTRKTYTPPVAVTYYFSNDTAVLSGKPAGMKDVVRGRGRQRPPTVGYNDATINVAGASAVVAMKNMTINRLDKNTTEVQFGAFSVYLPDGTVKSYKLDTPVKDIRSRMGKTRKIVGNSQFRADLQDALKGSATFPAGAAPVPLKTIDSKM